MLQSTNNNWLLIPATIMAWTAIESYVNNRLTDINSLPKSFELHEKAFLLEKRLHFHDSGEKLGEFSLEGSQYRRLEEKIFFIIARTRYENKEKFKGNILWNNFQDFKETRDGLIHPRGDQDVELTMEKVSHFIQTSKDIINVISKNLFGKEAEF